MIITLIRHIGPEAAERTAHYAAKARTSAGHGPQPGRRGAHAPGGGLCPRLRYRPRCRASASPSMPAKWPAPSASAMRSTMCARRVSAMACAPSRMPTWSSGSPTRASCSKPVPAPTSRSQVFPDFASHPLRALHEAGCRVTLNSDDPPFFHTSLKQEYEIASPGDGASATKRSTA